MKKLNWYEIGWGAAFGTAPAIACRDWRLLFMVPVCALLWAITGAGYGAFWRKVLMPTLTVLLIWTVKHHWPVWISLPALIRVLTMGYGIPSSQPPDPGSPFGRFWWDLTRKASGQTEKEHQDLTEIFVRGSIAILLILSFIPALF